MILAGDVGGTKVRLALFDGKGSSLCNCIDEQKFASHEFSDFSALLKKYLGQVDHREISIACFGVAGAVQNGKCQATNLPWIISAQVLKEELKIPDVYLINDLEANAWGLRCLPEEEFFVVNRGEVAHGNQALISAGTGLGEAGLYWDGKSHQPFACEGGHCDFAPTSDDEVELFQFLRRQYKHVSYERILSGSGLYQLYRFLIDTKREKENSSVAALLQCGEPQRVITEKALSGECRVCVRVCQLFISLYGSESGNTALKFLATGGVFIGGGIAPHLLSFFNSGSFIQAFMDKGRFSSLLMKIPVKVVLNEKTALIGAACYAKERD